MGRAEGYGIVAADEQYVVPTDGQPIRGLIQDHVVSAVLMTKRDGFFTCDAHALPTPKWRRCELAVFIVPGVSFCSVHRSLSDCVEMRRFAAILKHLCVSYFSCRSHCCRYIGMGPSGDSIIAAPATLCLRSTYHAFNFRTNSA